MKAFIVLLAAVLFAISPFFSPEFGGFDPHRFPIPQVNPPVQPAGWAFAIWGVIYLWLVLHAVYGVFRARTAARWQAGRGALIVSLAVGIIWLPVALASPVWATILIWVMLTSALTALYRMADASPRWIAVWPVALYAGWLSAASFVSVGLMLGGYDVVSEYLAALIALGLAFAFAFVHQWRLAHWPYAAAVAWGFVGISVANIGETLFISTLAAGAAVLIVSLALIQNLRSGRPAYT